MSETSFNQVIKRIVYDDRATGHGFRHTLSTILPERGYNSAWIETQLAHVDKNSIRGIYTMLNIYKAVERCYRITPITWTL
ncbi:tyrosine-type recombinase/integrase [Rosenbergiella nectarea]|uniref:tyrosine-type recombinase/integrase n=1 Tax=Rosenbergiella nectarea TaxID=988801 RepID=UPI003B82CEC4